MRPTYYVWRKRYGQMAIAEIRRFRQLEEENRKLKQLIADLTLDKVILRDVSQKGLKPTRKHALVRTDTAIRMRLRELAQAHRHLGYLRLHVMLRREDWVVNRKRVRRIYREEG